MMKKIIVSHNIDFGFSLTLIELKLRKATCFAEIYFFSYLQDLLYNIVFAQ